MLVWIGLALHEFNRANAGSLFAIVKIKGLIKAKKYIDNAFKQYVQTGKVKNVALDKQGTKGEGKRDDDRGAVLWWSY